MWSDHNENCVEVHKRLAASEVPGYLGYVTLGETVDCAAFMDFSSRLSLPRNVSIRDGRVSGGDDKYSVASGS